MVVDSLCCCDDGFLEDLGIVTTTPRPGSDGNRKRSISGRVLAGGVRSERLIFFWVLCLVDPIVEPLPIPIRDEPSIQPDVFSTIPT